MESKKDIISRKERLGISHALLAKTAGMSEPQLSVLLHRNKNPRQDTLMRLSDALDTIEQNHLAIANGVVILDVDKFKETIYQAIYPELESRDKRGNYDGDAGYLADLLIDDICKKLTKSEE